MINKFYNLWLSYRYNEVQQLIKKKLNIAPLSEKQKTLCLTLVELGSEERIANAIRIVLLVFAGIHGMDDETILPLAVCAVLIVVGTKLMDDVNDNDLSPELKKYSQTELIFASFILTCMLPQWLFTTFSSEINIINKLQATLSSGLLQAIDGEMKNLQNNIVLTPSVTDTEILAKNKTSISTTCSKLAAVYGNASDETISAYGDFHYHIGGIVQQFNDGFELFCTNRFNDLGEGRWTVLIAICYENLSQQEQTDFIQLLTAAKKENDARIQVRNFLRQPRFLNPWFEILKRYHQQAKEALNLANPLYPASDVFHCILDLNEPSVLIKNLELTDIYK